jgi:probable rRNA maturation factor
MIAFDPVVPEGCNEAHWQGVVDRSTLDRIGRAITTETGQSGAVALALADDAFVRNLNARFRRIDRATNVLSFPSSGRLPGAENGPAELQNEPPDTISLGDVALAAETISSEAGQNNTPLDNHIAHLIVHGTLHLLGHDHMQDSEAEEMEALERRILARLGISDPYASS